MKRVLSIVLIVAVLGAGGWWVWTRTPPYAVLGAADAVKSHDLAGFNTWVDVRSVAAASVEDLLAEPVRKTGSGILQRIIGIAIISLVKPVAVEAMSERIDSWVVHGKKAKASSYHLPPPAAADAAADDDDSDETEAPRTLLGAFVALVKPPSLRQIFHEYGLTRQNFRGLGSIDMQAHLSHVGLRFFNPTSKQEYQIQLELNDNSGHWEISRISNLQEVLTTLVGT